MSIWLHAIAIAPQNATKKQGQNAAGETEIVRLETTNATSAAQNGERLRTPAVMIGCALLRPTS